MATKIWSVTFGDNFASEDVVATNAEAAIKKARAKLWAEGTFHRCNSEKWASKVVLIAEAD